MKHLKAKGQEVRDTAWGADDNNHYLYVWSSQQLANLFRVAGYEVVDEKVLAWILLTYLIERGFQKPVKFSFLHRWIF